MRIAGKTAKIRTEPSKISCHTVSYKIAAFGTVQRAYIITVNVIHNGYCPLHLFTELNGPIIYQSIPAAPRHPPSPGLLWGICPPCQSRGWGICKFCTARGPGICQPRGQPRAFATHSVSYQNMTTQRILLEKLVD